MEKESVSMSIPDTNKARDFILQLRKKFGIE